MTRPTPKPAPEAPLLPRRGEGMGVRPPARPRPGPEPGPRPIQRATRSGEIPGQARDGVIVALLALLLAPPAAAQIIPTGSPAADIVLSQALADQRVFLTCTALDPDNHRIILDFWRQDSAAAVAILTEHAVPPEAIAAFTAAADPAALALPPDTPFAEVRDYCQAQTHWFMRMNRRDFTELAVALPEAFR